MPEQPPTLTLEQQALLAVRQMRRKLESIEQERNEPIAIVGVACRFPGKAMTLAGYAQLLAENGNAVADVPATRFDLASIFDPNPDVPGKTYCRSAGLVREVECFDADFFGISPREALSLDPQQRMLLEVSWEALERAGINPASLTGSDGGVFIGLTTSEYAQLYARSVAPADYSAHMVGGSALNAAAGRLSYTLGWHGPSLVIDTACSSSLVAIDRACRSLREEECHLALAGGANVMAVRESFITACKAGMLAHDGLCKAFDAAADGFVRGEGCGVVVLKRLRDAVAAGDRIWALIRGSAVNQDGPSSGLTVPNGLAQQALLRRALKAAGVAGSQVGYVEAHGTGTALGDPIEVEALGQVYGESRDGEQPLFIGSVKTNLGHLEAAAGMAGLIKVVLGLNEQVMPPQLHWRTPSPHIRWDELPVLVVTEPRPWAPIAGRRLAGVSAFGFSGTNAHLIVEEAPALAPRPSLPAQPVRESHLLTITAKNEPVLKRLAQSYAEFLAGCGASAAWADVCHTANVARAHWSHRLSILARDTRDGLLALQAYLRGERVPAVAESVITPNRPKVEFWFGSLESIRVRDELSGYLAFSEALARCEALFPLTSESALAFACLYGIAALWRSWGVSPRAVFPTPGTHTRAAAFLAPVLTGTASLEEAWRGFETGFDLEAAPVVEPSRSAVRLHFGDGGQHGVGIACLRPGVPLLPSLAQAVQALDAAGVEIDWAGWDRGYAYGRIDLPTYPFERQRFWVEEPSQKQPVALRSGLAARHPLLGVRLQSALDTVQFESNWGSGEELRWLEGHRVQGQTVLAGAGLIELLLAAATESGNDRARPDVALQDIVLIEPLSWPSPLERPTVQVLVDGSGSDSARVRVFSQSQAAGNGHIAAGEQTPTPWRLHVEARVARQTEPAVEDSLSDRRARCTEPLDRTEFYERLASLGMGFAPEFQGISQLWRGDGEALGEVRLDQESGSRWMLYPPVFDACLQVAAAALIGHDALPGQALYLPFQIERLHVYAPLGRTVFSHVQVTALDAQAPACDVSLFDADGKLLARLHRLVFRAAHAPAANPLSSENAAPVYGTSWAEADLAQDDAPAINGHWIVLADANGFGRSLATALAAAGCTCTLVFAGSAYAKTGLQEFTINPSNAQDYERLLTETPAANGIVHLFSLDSPPLTDINTAKLMHSQTQGYLSALLLTQAILQSGTLDDFKLAFVSRGTNAVWHAREVVSSSGPSLWSLRRTLAAEHPQLRSYSLDLDPADRAHGQASVISILRQREEAEVAIRARYFYVPRLQAVEAEQAGAAEKNRVELVPSSSGLIEDLAYRQVPRHPPEADEVEIQVRATGLNFRDVLHAFGMLPQSRPAIGGECAGVVVRAGSESGLVPGREVFAFAPGWFSSYATVPARYVGVKPAHLSFEQAAGLPIAYMTAIFGLRRLARLKRGQTVLIHSAAGGLGLAAVRIAQIAGATIYATAGSEKKRSFLRSLGVKHVFASRNLEFADGIRSLTKGAGVDVVLNSLSGEFIEKSLGLVKHNGCFLEVGKRGILQRQDAARLRPDVLYYAFDLGEEALRDQGFIPSLLDELLCGVEDGSIEALPTSQVPFANARQAFRTMAAAQHIGKIVVRHDASEVAAGALPIEAQATYLITGGLGALGRHTAAWLIERGARHLLLVSRTGPTPEFEQQIDQWAQDGVQISVAKADCADLGRMIEIVRSIEPAYPLRGVIHAAGELADATLEHQTAASFAQVARAKVEGAWALHDATLDRPLHFFLLYSSAAAILPSGGQANYAAANALADALAYYRQSIGLPALSVNWGPWAGAGMLASIDTSGRDAGFHPMTPAEAFSALLELARMGVAQGCVLPGHHWPQFFRGPGSDANPAFFRLLKQTASSVARERELERPFSEMLKREAPASRRALVLNLVNTHATRVLGLEGQRRLDEFTPLNELGLDSLLAVELRNSLSKTVGRPLPASLLFDHPSPGALADYLQAAALPPAPANVTSVAELSSLSDEAAEALLLAELNTSSHVL